MPMHGLSPEEKGYVIKKANLGWSPKKIASTMKSAGADDIKSYLASVSWKKLPRVKINDRIGQSVRLYNQSKKPISLAPLPGSWT